MVASCHLRGGSRIFERGGGSILGLQAKKGGGGPRGGPTLGPMLKSLHRGPKEGGRTLLLHLYIESFHFQSTIGGENDRLRSICK